MDLESALHEKSNRINSYARGSEAHLEHDETLCECLGGKRRSYQIPSNDVTFESRPLCNLTRCIAL